MALEYGIGFERIVAQPDALLEKSVAIQQASGRLNREFEELTRLTNNTGFYWLGDAAEEHRAAYRELAPEIQEMFLRLQEHASDLQAIAQRYAGAQESVERITSALPTDAIE